MKKNSIFSIGHGIKKIEDFIDELNSFNIKYVIDVRSKPYSKHNPQYNKQELNYLLKEKNIKYVFLGDKLGGLPQDLTCYTNGKVDYNKLKQKMFFIEGIKRLIKANNKGLNVAIMCSETKPRECHRSKLIGEVLMQSNINTKHIVGIKKYKNQNEVINEVNKGLNSEDIFGHSAIHFSRKKYLNEN